jgi:hypothetical protein
MFDRGFFFISHAVRRQLAAMPNDFYLIRLIHGCTRRPCPGERVFLIRVGGHFNGLQVLHWASGERCGGVLMTGDMPQVCPDRRYVSFMYSYPNFIPVNGQTVREIVMKLEHYKFGKLYGAWLGFVVEGDPKMALRRSAERYLRAIGDLTPLNAQHFPAA